MMVRSITGMENAGEVVPGPQLPPGPQFLPTESDGMRSSSTSSSSSSITTGLDRLGMEDRLKDIFRF